jgi:hypothetical protein
MSDSMSELNSINNSMTELEDLPLLNEKPHMNTSNPYEEENVNKDQNCCKMLKDILINLKVGLPSVFSVGDYLMVVIILKLLVAYS